MVGGGELRETEEQKWGKEMRRGESEREEEEEEAKQRKMEEEMKR